MTSNKDKKFEGKIILSKFTTFVIIIQTKCIYLDKYKYTMKTFDLFDARVSYSSMDDNTTLSLIELVRNGIKYSLFQEFANTIPFSLSEWSTFLHISTRSMQRYQVEQRTFDALQSEKIVEIAMLYKKGIEIFGNARRFNTWLEAENIALGNIKPKKLLDSSFGISMINDELTRIEHGVLA